MAGRRLTVLDEGHGDLPYGGNKVRKLRGLLRVALACGARDVLTYGAWGSHHVHATAVWAERVGLRVHAVWIRQPPTPHVEAMARASSALCASVQVARTVGEVPVVAAATTARILARTGRSPFQVPPGGSNSVGDRGWVEAGEELGALGLDVDCVVVASGSGGTAAGLLASGHRVVAVRVGPRVLTNRARLRHLARRAGAASLGELVIDGSYLAGGYGHIDARTREVCRQGRSAGLPVETTYSAKALACALDRAGRGERVLFVQTASAAAVRPGKRLGEELRCALGLDRTSTFAGD